MKPELSIIIPYKNTVVYLTKLLESIVFEADFNSTQTIVVNDNSNLNLDEYDLLKRKYSKYVEFYDNNKISIGAGAARNVGLSKAKGKWLLFADADDFFVSGWYPIVKSYFDSEYDVIFFEPTSVDYTDIKYKPRHIQYKELINNYNKHKCDKTRDRLCLDGTVVYSKMINHSFVVDNDILFDEVFYSNDVMFSAKIGLKAKNIKASNQIIYCITKNEGSLTWKNSLETIYKRKEVGCKKYNYLKSNLSRSRFNKLSISSLRFRIMDYVITKYLNSECDKDMVKRFNKLFECNNVSWHIRFIDLKTSFVKKIRGLLRRIKKKLDTNK